jgi:hypothetical protein
MRQRVPVPRGFTLYMPGPWRDTETVPRPEPR